MKLTNHELEGLLAIKSPHEFLSFIFEIKKLQDKNINYAQLARKTGLSSRSYVRELLTGKKSLNSKSAHLLSKALGLKSDIFQLFNSLFLLSSLKKGSAEYESLLASTKKVKCKIKNKIKGTKTDNSYPFKINYFSLVYASLGTPENGSSVEQISKRSGLKLNVVQVTLKELESLDLVKQDPKSKQWKPINIQLFYERMPSGSFFHQHFEKRLTESQKAARELFHTEEALFWEGTFSVSSKDIPKFRVELKEFFEDFIQNSESPEGEEVVSLTSSFFSLTKLNKQN